MKLGTLCYIRNKNKTLFLHRNKKENDSMGGYWIGLGGHVDIKNGESPHDCIIREVKEESGLTIKPKLRGIVTFRHVEDDKHDWYAYLFSATQIDSNLIESSEGDLEWINDKKLRDINIPEGDRLFLKWLKQNDKVFSAKFIYEDKKLIKHSVVFY